MFYIFATCRMIEYDAIHEETLLQWLRILRWLLQEKEREHLFPFLNFTWGTSLLLKYEDFYRFSVDLDFSIHHQSKEYEKQWYALFDEMKTQLEKHLRQQSVSVFESENSRELYFVGQQWTRGIKIDWMYDLTLETEILQIQDMSINKASDYDIILNKLMRLNPTDIKDIEFLWNKNDINIENIISWLQQKWEKAHGNKYYLINKSKHLRQKNINKLFILSDLMKCS